MAHAFITALRFAGRLLLYLVASRARLAAENLALRQQLVIYRRKNPRPSLRDRDRLFWALLSRIWPNWRTALVVVKPDTVIRWQRRLFREFWYRKCRDGRRGRPRIRRYHVQYIRRISADHPEYGEDRIALELELKFGIKHSTATIRKYMVRPTGPRRPTQSWRTFLKNQADAIWMCDFCVQQTVRFKALYIFVIMELGSRKVVHINVTRHPTQAWVRQQIRNAAFHGEPKFLVHDNDGIFGQLGKPVTVEVGGKKVSCRSAFDVWLADVMGIRGLPTPYHAPNAQAHVERLIGTLRRELLDRILVWNEGQLRTVLAEYTRWYNAGRVHQGIHGIPDPDPELLGDKPADGKLVARPVCGGLHHDYRAVA
jgi:putative transposase